MTAPRPLCRNCGRTIHRVLRSVSFGHGQAVRYRRPETFQEFPDSIVEVERLTKATVISVEWVSDIERWVKHAVVWDGKYANPFFCGRGCAQQFGYYHAATGAATDKHAEAVLRQIRALTVCPERNEVRSNQAWFVPGRGMLEFMWRCFVATQPRNLCATTYDLQVWGDHQPIVRFLKSKATAPAGMKELYDGLLSQEG